MGIGVLGIRVLGKIYKKDSTQYHNTKYPITYLIAIAVTLHHIRQEIPVHVGITAFVKT